MVVKIIKVIIGIDNVDLGNGCLCLCLSWVCGKDVVDVKGIVC